MKFFLFSCFLLPALLHAQVKDLDSLITKKSLEQTVSLLSSDQLSGRLTGSAGAVQASAFIAENFRVAGLVYFPGRNAYFDSFPAMQYRKKVTGQNVIGYFPAEIPTDTLVIFSAHYDHIGVGNDIEFNKDYRSDDAIYNGANDNATGVAALLELARYYTAQRNSRHNLLFIAFAGEEMGLIGSSAFVKKINTKLVQAVINLEMLGRPVNERCYIIALGNSRVRNQLNNSLAASAGKTANKFFGSDPYYEDNLGYRSDHYPFAGKVKNSFTIMASSPTDIYYHTVDDEFETIDFDFLLKATKNIALACEHFVK